MTSMRREATAGRSLAMWIGLACQVGLGVTLAWFALTSGWLASSTGFVSLVGGGLALVVASVWWSRTGARPALILVDLWFVSYGSLVVNGAANPNGMDDGFRDWMHEVYAALLGGADPVVGLAWGGFGLLGAIAVWRSRR